MGHTVNIKNKKVFNHQLNLLLNIARVCFNQEREKQTHPPTHPHENRGIVSVKERERECHAKEQHVSQC